MEAKCLELSHRVSIFLGATSPQTSALQVSAYESAVSLASECLAALPTEVSLSVELFT